MVTFSNHNRQSPELMDELMWDNLEIRRSKQLAVLMYTTINKSAPNYLTKIFENKFRAFSCLSKSQLNLRSFKNLIDWLVGWLVDWLIDWLIDWSIDRLIDWLIVWYTSSDNSNFVIWTLNLWLELIYLNTTACLYDTLCILPVPLQSGKSQLIRESSEGTTAVNRMLYCGMSFV